MKKVFFFFILFVFITSICLTGCDNIYDSKYELLMSFVAFSDTHVEGNNDDSFYRNNLKNAFEDINNLERPVNAVLIGGDLTDNGYDEQYDGLKYALQSWKTGELMMCLGNHDSGRDLDGGFGEAKQKFYDTYNGVAPGYISEKLYYDKWINGYHFIVLSTEKDLWDAAYFSDEQMAWLEEKLAEDASPDKPIFVMSHWPVADTVDRSDSDDNNAGEQSKKLEELFKKYKQVVYLAGHIHSEYGYENLNNTDMDGEANFVKLPNQKGGTNTEGTYLYFLVYENRVDVKVRDFKNGKWLTEYDFFIPNGYITE